MAFFLFFKTHMPPVSPLSKIKESIISFSVVLQEVSMFI